MEGLQASVQASFNFLRLLEEENKLGGEEDK